MIRFQAHLAWKWRLYYREFRPFIRLWRQVTRKCRWVGLGLSLFGFGCDVSDPAAPVSSTSSLNPVPVAQTVMTYDDLLLSVAREVPVFGGFYPDSGRTVVWLTDTDVAQQAAVRQAITRAGEEAKRIHEVSFVVHSGALLAFRKAGFTFDQLYSWKRSLYSRGVPSGTSFVGIDKRQNRLSVGVVDAATETAWRTRSRDAGIPAEALAIATAPPIPPASTLQGKVRPIVGGTLINGPNTCSMTTGVTYRLDPPHNHFLTASHCSVQQWALDNPQLEYSQPSIPDPLCQCK